MAHIFMFTCPYCGKEFQFSYGLSCIVPDEKTLKRAAGFKETQQFIEEHPNGVVDCNYVVKRCKKCGALKNTNDFSMYLPVNENEPLKYGNYFFDDPERYVKFKDVSFRCNKCGGKAAELIEMDKLMEIIKNEGIECPKCGCKLGYDTCDFLKS